MTKKDFLRAKDHQVFDLLYRFKVARVEDIGDLLFKGKDLSNVYRRLRQLLLLGYLQKVPCEKDGRYTMAYSLTKASFKKVTGQQGKGDGIRQQFLSNNTEHDLAIFDIYKKFIKSPRIVDFLTENLLMCGSTLIRPLNLEDWIKNNPDGILVDQTPEGRYFLPLECELSAKAGFRYETKLLNYYKSGKVPAVIYVCKNGQVRDAIRSVDEQYCHPYRPKVFYGLLGQFHNGSEALVFTNRRGGQLKF